MLNNSSRTEARQEPRDGEQGSEGDHEEGRGVLPGVHQVRERPLGVAVTPETLDEPEPGRETLDHGADAVGSPAAGFGLTFAADEAVVFLPVQLKAVEADHVLQIHQSHAQRVQLVRQPEVSKAHVVKGSRHHPELWSGEGAESEARQNPPEPSTGFIHTTNEQRSCCDRANTVFLRLRLRPLAQLSLWASSDDCSSFCSVANRR
ncbi:hypothetical protein EYF80_034284 [Liparis tanakae]|uniref:Uncharacterized protein n=1 Tax=Liparis tanakae TaxID=230148 RepID=A0A4Z2GS50_9TELE|nr:hypothetical protein EYF80_034284 [Liparis tanakae]